jgi:hypothetical protein
MLPPGMWEFFFTALKSFWLAIRITSSWQLRNAPYWGNININLLATLKYSLVAHMSNFLPSF